MEGRGCRWSSGRRRRERNHRKSECEELGSGSDLRVWALCTPVGGRVGETLARAPGHSLKSDLLANSRLLTPSGSIVLPSACRVVESPLASSSSPLHHGLLLLATDVFTHVHPQSLGAAFSVFPSCSRCVARPGRSSQGQSPPWLQTLPSIRTSMMWWSLGRSPSQDFISARWGVCALPLAGL
jgi:hypothetical protein